MLKNKPLLVAASFALVGTLGLGLAGCSTPKEAASGAEISAAASSQSSATNAVTVGSVVDKSTVLAQTSVGTMQYVIAEEGDVVRIGQIDTSEGTELLGWMSYSEKAAAEDSIVVSNGNSPEYGENGLADASGRVGSRVTGVDVVTSSGETVKAVIANGWFVAAWEGSDFTNEETMNQQYVIHLADGSSKTLSASDVATFN